MVEAYKPINIDELMQKVRNEAAQIHPRLSKMNSSELIEINATTIANINHIEALLNNAENKAQVRTELPKKLSRFPFNISKPLQKIALKTYTFLFKEQRAINFSLIQSLREILELNRQLIKQVTILQEQVTILQEQVDEIKTHQTAIDERNIKTNERNIKNNSYLNQELAQQKRLITLFLEEARQRLPESFNREQLQTLLNEEERLPDALYVAFEEQFRGSREEILDKLKIYLPLIEDAKVGTPESPILDIGCGRGEWLELLRESGYVARGIDMNQVMLEDCQTRELDVVEGDAITYLQNLPDASLGSITGFHIIEHLPFADLIKLLDEAMRVLKPGGMVLFETPNPRNILVGAGDFYRDPTHKNPIHPDTISYLATLKGFVNTESYFFENKEGITQLLAASDIRFDTLDSYVSISRDFVLIGYKT